MKVFPTSYEVAIYAAIKAGHHDGASITRITGVPGGTIYPVLTRLETQGVLVSHWEEGDVRALGRPLMKLYRLVAPLPGLDRLLAVLVYAGLTS
ncbi:hypothetical protein ACFFLM_04530 [Deinococcus oregonensis]|uniref:Transcription regulator PadR N-terminal domain-containing protein n=1 Tax=Deinococcus oregonensis TaxID=1805970 RepID=A0ABV6AUQ9_9DEIO